MEITVLNNQTLFDIALQLSGSAEAAFEIALENGLSVADDLTPGQVLQFSGTPINKAVVEYYRVNGIKPATADGVVMEDSTIVEVVGVVLSCLKTTLTTGDSVNVTATVFPTNATFKGVSFSSSNESVATVSETGRVTSLQPGTAIITVKTADGGFRDSITFAVTNYDPVFTVGRRMYAVWNIGILTGMSTGVGYVDVNSSGLGFDVVEALNFSTCEVEGDSIKLSVAGNTSYESRPVRLVLRQRQTGKEIIAYEAMQGCAAYKAFY